MNILFVTHTFPPENRPEANLGGMQRVAIDLYSALLKHPGVSVYPLALYTSWKMTHVKTPLFLAKILRSVPRLVAHNKIDVVLFSSMVTAATAWRLRKRLKKPAPLLAAIAHGRDVTLPVGLYQRFVPHVFDALDLVLPVSRATSEACIERGLPADRARVVPNGVDPDLFNKPPLFENRRKVLLAGFPGLTDYLRDDHVALCSVGRHVLRKGFDWFVEQVLPDLPDRTHYLLAGEGDTASLVEAAASRLGLSGRVHQLGRVPHRQLEALYSGADLFVMPNRRVAGDMEGFGVVLLEASLCGLPVLGARLEGIQDAITEGQNGWLVEAERAPAMTGAITSLINHPDRLEGMSTSTRSFTIAHHSWSGIAVRVCNELASRANVTFAGEVK